jgi:hypothetical protein
MSGWNFYAAFITGIFTRLGFALLRRDRSRRSPDAFQEPPASPASSTPSPNLAVAELPITTSRAVVDRLLGRRPLTPSSISSRSAKGITDYHEWRVDSGPRPVTGSNSSAPISKGSTGVEVCYLDGPRQGWHDIVPLLYDVRFDRMCPPLAIALASIVEADEYEILGTYIRVGVTDNGAVAYWFASNNP